MRETTPKSGLRCRNIKLGDAVEVIIDKILKAHYGISGKTASKSRADAKLPSKILH